MSVALHRVQVMLHVMILSEDMNVIVLQVMSDSSAMKVCTVEVELKLSKLIIIYYRDCNFFNRRIFHIYSYYIFAIITIHM